MHNIYKKNYQKKGFTLVEMLVVIGLIALLSTAVLVAVNPARQFKSARDATRHAHLSAMLNAIGQNMTEHKGVFSCGGVLTNLPPTPTNISSNHPNDVDLEKCLVPTYLSSIPEEPTEGFYQIFQDEQGYISLISESELDPSSPIILTR